MKLPEHGRSEAELMADLDAYGEGDLKWREGRIFAYVYDPGPEVDAVAKKAYMRYLTENALDPTAFPSLVRFENEVVAIARDHLNGDSEVVGNFTSGGTESCMLAVKTARDYFRAVKPEITEPEIVLPVTAHAAFQKGAHYMGLKPVLVPVNPHTYRADPAQMEAAMTPNTVLVVASAPSYAHGVVDPVPEIAALAQKHGVLCHVDGCVGGFMLPFFRELGLECPDFDFSVPGVTSMSMDLHKYAYCPKGASVILHKNKDLRRHQIFTCSDWTGYTVINPTILSTKSGGPLAACWTVLNHVGKDGYRALARRMWDATWRLVEGIEKIPGLKLLTKPDFCMFAIGSDDFSIFTVIDDMKKRGWFIQPQLGFLGSQANAHISVYQRSEAEVDAFLADLAKAAAAAPELERGPEHNRLVNALERYKSEGLTDELFLEFFDIAGVADGDVPERLGPLNQILNSLPPEFTKEALTDFMNDLYRYQDTQASSV